MSGNSSAARKLDQGGGRGYLKLRPHFIFDAGALLAGFASKQKNSREFYLHGDAPFRKLVNAPCWRDHWEPAVLQGYLARQEYPS